MNKSMPQDFALQGANTSPTHPLGLRANRWILGLRALRWFLLLLFGWAVARTAWVGDDAYITMRTVENFAQGYGLRWNVLERVQTYSHPLWMLLAVVGRMLTGEVYSSILVISAICTLGAVFLAGFRLATSAVAGACALALLVFCKAFVEYSTSGLESPLTHLLLAGYAVLLFSDLRPQRRLFLMALVTGLAATNRMDTVLLFAPGLLLACKGLRMGQIVRLGFFGFLPFTAWLVFATVYYGTPLPITAYAKAMTGIAPWDLLVQGGKFYRDVATRDPVLLPALVLGFGYALWSRSWPMIALAAGGLLYCAYILKIGGGFMAGRFLTPPLFLAAICIARMPLSGARKWPAMALLVSTSVLGFLCPTTPILSTPNFAERTVNEESGIADERGFYYGGGGLFSPNRQPYRYDSIDEVAGIEFDKSSPETVVWFGVGYVGFMVGPGAHLVDPWLTDPLMMRLPTRDLKNWRIGHFDRRIPEGYLESLASKQNQIRDPGLGRVHGELQTILRADVFDKARWKAMWNMWTGAWKPDLKAFVEGEYRNPPMIEVPIESLSEEHADSLKWWQGDFPLIGRGGMGIALGETRHSKKMTVGLDGGDVYGFHFYLGDRMVGNTKQTTKGGYLIGIGRYEIDVPKQVSGSGI